MQSITFLEDVWRFARSGQFLTLCGLLFARLEVWIIGGGVAVAFVLFSTPLEKALVVFLAVMIAYLLFAQYTVQFLSPLYFGAFVIGRLTTKARPADVLPALYDRFVLWPEGREIYVTYYGKRPDAGAVGQSYVLLLHPADQDTALAIIDDDQRYVNRILQCASPQRGQEIMKQLSALRGNAA
jgi:hypothetical protein